MKDAGRTIMKERCSFLYYLWNGIKEGMPEKRHDEGIRGGNLSIFMKILSGYIKNGAERGHDVSVLQNIKKGIEGSVENGELSGKEISKVNRVLLRHSLYDSSAYRSLSRYYGDFHNFVTELKEKYKIMGEKRI
ncbi:hypothetical protein HYT92_02070 [Candidatus Pacearchaeota archaeon]|nr:hypothetical protein [Candidatus Pacearchaeota archaeon]